MKFFIDENLGFQLAAGMSGFGESAVHLTEVFERGAQDVDWLRYVGENDLILVTRDERVRWNPAELLALKDHSVGAFFLGGKNRSRCDLIQQLVRNWPRMKELERKTRRPFAFKVPPSGSKLVSLPLP